jgi:hypothetical protein
MCTPPFPSIPIQVAKDSISLFKDHKKTAIKKAHPAKDEKEFISYDPAAFLSLLTRFSDPVKKYTGFRVYPASFKAGSGDQFIPVQEEELLTLIFIPTTGSTTQPQSDLTNCCFIFNNQVVSKDATQPDGQFIRDWIKYYQGDRITELEKDGKIITGNDNFSETRSLYYLMDNFGHRPGSGSSSGNDGVIDYIECRMKDPVNTLTAVVAYFAGFPVKAVAVGGTTPIGYQLTLIFDFPPPTIPAQGGSTYFAFTASDKKHDHKGKHHHHPFDDDPVDTGNPCPPNVCDPTFP